MRILHFPKDLIRHYYTFDFNVDLMNYFDIKPMVNHRNIPFIGHLTEHFNSNRNFDGAPARRRYRLHNIHEGAKTSFYVDEKETEKNFIFAGIFYFLVLVPQTLRKMFGLEVEHDFYRCTGWPLISAGLGGSLPPSRMLEEVSLFPCETEQHDFHRMLTEVVPFMNIELRRFFIPEDKGILNDAAYERVLTRMGDNVEDFLLSIMEESTRFTSSFNIRSQ